MHSRVMLPAWLTRYGEWLFDLLINLPTTDNFFRSFSVQIAAGQLFSGHCRSNGIYAKLHVYFHATVQQVDPSSMPWLFSYYFSSTIFS